MRVQYESLNRLKHTQPLTEPRPVCCMSLLSCSGLETIGWSLVLLPSRCSLGTNKDGENEESDAVIANGADNCRFAGR